MVMNTTRSSFKYECNNISSNFSLRRFIYLVIIIAFSIGIFSKE
jgi:hypothetical protein